MSDWSNVESKLHAILPTVDPDKTNTIDIFNRLSEELGISISKYKKKIRVRLDAS